MISKVLQLENVSSLSLSERLVVRFNNGDICLVDNNELVKLVENTYAYEMFNGKLLYQLKNLDKLNRIDLNSDSTSETIDGSFSLKGGFYADKNYSYVLGKENGLVNVYILDSESLHVLSVIEYVDFPSMSVSAGCICRRKSEVKYVDPLLRETFWSYLFSNDEEIMGDFYVHEDVLVVCSMMGQIPFNKNYITGIDIESGREIWRRESYFVYFQQDFRSGLLYGFADERYEVVDPRGGKILYESNFAGLIKGMKLQVYQNMSKLFDRGLYFVGDNIQNVFSCQFGRINIRSHNIEFVERLEISEGVKANPPLSFRGRIYIKDTLDVLHVFEDVKSI